ncbi:MAG: MXAN_2562 family outer membrane beta-barrel protein [Myxococcota bacterium]
MGISLDESATANNPGLYCQPNWRIEMRFAPYQPRISKNAQARQFFKQVHASGLEDALISDHPVMTSFEVDYYLNRKFGLLGLVSRIGFWNVNGRARVCSDASSTCTPEEAADPNLSEAGNTPVSLGILPLSLGLVYRADFLKRYYRIPLVPHVKAGIDYHLWWARANGKIAKSTDGGKSGRGATWGYHAAIGLSFDLDWVDPSVRRSDESSYVNTALFAELQTNVGDGFGDSSKLNMSDTIVALGLALDFQ